MTDQEHKDIEDILNIEYLNNQRLYPTNSIGILNKIIEDRNFWRNKAIAYEKNIKDLGDLVKGFKI